MIAPKVPVKCNECGKRWTVAATTPTCPVCSRCGSVDIDVIEPASHRIRAIKDDADDIRPITLDEARRLPDLLGRIAPAMLRAHGYYAVTIGDRKVFYELKEAVAPDGGQRGPL